MALTRSTWRPPTFPVGMPGDHLGQIGPGGGLAPTLGGAATTRDPYTLWNQSQTPPPTRDPYTLWNQSQTPPPQILPPPTGIAEVNPATSRIAPQTPGNLKRVRTYMDFFNDFAEIIATRGLSPGQESMLWNAYQQLGPRGAFDMLNAPGFGQPPAGELPLPPQVDNAPTSSLGITDAMGVTLLGDSPNDPWTPPPVDDDLYVPPVEWAAPPPDGGVTTPPVVAPGGAPGDPGIDFPVPGAGAPVAAGGYDPGPIGNAAASGAAAPPSEGDVFEYAPPVNNLLPQLGPIYQQLLDAVSGKSTPPAMAPIMAALQQSQDEESQVNEQLLSLRNVSNSSGIGLADDERERLGIKHRGETAARGMDVLRDYTSTALAPLAQIYSQGERGRAQSLDEFSTFLKMQLDQDAISESQAIQAMALMLNSLGISTINPQMPNFSATHQPGLLEGLGGLAGSLGPSFLGD